MAFGNKFGGGKGGKKGPRAHNGSFKTKGVKLRPQPEKTFLDASSSNLINSTSVNNYDCLEEEEDESKQEFSYVDNLKEEKRPLDRCMITITGCATAKLGLYEIAQEMGGEKSESLTNRTTHLIADVASGTQKLDMAHKTGIKVMLPEWLEEVRRVWTSAEEVDFPYLEETYSMPLFHGFSFSLTGFARGPHKDNLAQLLSSHGATVSAKLHLNTTHLIVASPTSPHSQSSLNSKKIDEAIRLTEKNLGPKVVWEGWVTECTKRGYVKSGREEEWKWVRGEGEPNVLWEDERTTLPNISTAMEEGEEEAAVVRKKAQSRIARHQLNDVDDLLNSYSKASTSTLDQLPSLLSTHRSRPALLAKSSDLELPTFAHMAGDNYEDESQIGNRKGKGIASDISERDTSVIKALSNSRSNSFLNPPHAPKPFSSSTAVPPSAIPTFNLPHSITFDDRTSTADDSGFMESTFVDPDADIEDEEEVDLPFFSGLKFFVSGGGNHEKVSKEAVLERAGLVVDDEDEADWIVVPWFKADKKYSTSNDGRIVTGAWVESCIYANAVVEPGKRLLDRPFAFKVPFERGEDINAHVSGFDRLEKIHIDRFVRGLGGSIHDTLIKSRSHLIDGRIEEDHFEGPKVFKARKWGIEVLGTQGLIAWAKKHGVVEEEKVGAFEGCTVGFAAKFKTEHKEELGGLTEALEANSATISTQDLTHLILVGAKTTVAGKELKSLSDESWIVHPAWVFESIKAGYKLSEGDFPHTYDPKRAGQLVGLVASPPRRQASRRILSPRSRTTSVLSERRSRSISAVIDEKEFVAPPERHQSPTSFLKDVEEAEEAQVSAADISTTSTTGNDRNSLLRQQTSALLAELGNSDPLPPPGSKRKFRVGVGARNKNNQHSPLVPPPLPPSGVRRVPGMGYEQSQFSQAEEESIVMIYRDINAEKASRDIQEALSGGKGEKRGREDDEAEGERRRRRL